MHLRRARLLGLCLAAAALVTDRLAPAAVVKAPALLVAAAAALALSWRRWRATAGGVLLALLAGWLGASLLWSAHPQPVELAPWIGAATLAPAIAGLDPADRRQAAGWFAVAVVWVSSAAAAFERMRGLVVGGLQGNPNHLGLCLAVSLPLALNHEAERASDMGNGQAQLALFALGAVGLWLSQSRAAWIGLLVACALLLRGKFRWLAAAPLSAALGYAVARGDLVHSAGGRLWIARGSLLAASHSLPLGAGVGSFPFGYLDAQAELLAPLDPALAARRFLNATTAHGSWLQLLCEGGPVALALAAGLIAACLRARPPRALSLSLLTAAVAAAGDDVFALPAVAVLLAFGAAETRPWPLRGLHRVVPACLLAGSAALLPACLRRYAAERTLHAADALDPPARLVALERAAHLDDSDGEARLDLGLALLEAGQAQQAVSALQASRARLANPGTSVALGNAWLDLDRADDAIAAYRQAVRFDPGSFRGRANLAEALRRAGQLDLAASELAVARRLRPGNPKVARIAEALRKDRVDAATR